MDRGSLSKGRGTPRESPRARFAKSVWPGLYGRKSQAAKQLGTVSERSQYLSSLLSYYHIIQVVSLSLLNLFCKRIPKSLIVLGMPYVSARRACSKKRVFVGQVPTFPPG